VTIQPRSRSPLLDLVAVLVVAVACPAALFGGSLIGCVSEGFTPDCALNAWFISPVLLVGAGVAAGLLTRGWTGLLLMWVGVAIGMTALLLLSYAAGRPVPLDPISGFIATIWFLTPVIIGYGIGRLVSRLVGRGGGSPARGA
jgi:hypothetical protein